MYESEIIHESFRLGAAYKRQRHLESEEKYRDAKEKPPHGHGRILKNLVLHGSMTQSELAEILQIRPQSLTVAMQKLEEQGYVLRERDPKNRRQVLVSVTEEGKKHSGIRSGRVPRRSCFRCCQRKKRSRCTSFS